MVSFLFFLLSFLSVVFFSLSNLFVYSYSIYGLFGVNGWFVRCVKG